MSDNSTQNNELRRKDVSDEEVNKDIEKWAGDGKTIVVVGAYTHCKDNIKIKESDVSASGSGEGTSDSTSNSAAVVAADEQGKFNLEQVKNGMYISAKPMENKKAKDAQKEEKESQEDHEKE